jgi:hypothetical protein
VIVQEIKKPIMESQVSTNVPGPYLIAIQSIDDTCILCLSKRQMDQEMSLEDLPVSAQGDAVIASDMLIVFRSRTFLGNSVTVLSHATKRVGDYSTRRRGWS